jgi:hypothetical protein
MTCSKFDRWLDEGMPEPASDHALAHARACVRCAAALETARAVESALAKEVAPTRAPAGFSSSVMARVRASESALAREARPLPTSPWWIAILSDPVSSVSITVAALTLALLLWNPEMVLRLGGWLGAHWSEWVVRRAEIPMHPIVWLAFLATAGPLVLWGIWEIGRNLERVLVLHVTRPVR